MKKLSISIVILLILGLGLFAAYTFWQTTSYNSSKYYAIFLSNGQVYFGHIVKRDSQIITLTNVFYLKANPKLQNSQGSSKDIQGNVDLSLIKLGKEIHGPSDTLEIVIPQVLFWEQLRDDSRIVGAIQQYPK
jgi:hypothetical protein